MIGFTIFILVVGFLSLIFAKYLADVIHKQETGNEKMNEISDAIHEGSMAFLKREYKVMAWFIVVMGLIIALFLDHPSTSFNEAPWTALSFVLGCVFSMVAGYIGMKIATKTNVRTTQAARTSLPNALKISFGGGTVMGLGVAGLAVLGLTSFFIFF